jgi:hypothetical protein
MVCSAVVSEKNGTWGKPILIPGTAPLGGARITAGSVSCGSAGNCAVTGTYLDSSRHQQAFVVSERNGSWGKAIAVPGLAMLNTGGHAQVYSASCAPAGYCAVGGYYVDRSGAARAFVVNRT